MGDSAPHVMLVEARFYPDIADELLRGAMAALAAAGATHERVDVPGAFEIPAAIALAAAAGAAIAGGRAFDGFVALGCVIRGETTHYDYVCQESARALQNLAVDRQLAIGFGILTCENRDQAWHRAAVDKRNKGGEATEACLAMIRLKSRFGRAAQ